MRTSSQPRAATPSISSAHVRALLGLNRARWQGRSASTDDYDLGPLQLWGRLSPPDLREQLRRVLQALDLDDERAIRALDGYFGVSGVPLPQEAVADVVADPPLGPRRIQQLIATVIDEMTTRITARPMDGASAPDRCDWPGLRALRTRLLDDDYRQRLSTAMAVADTTLDEVPAERTRAALASALRTLRHDVSTFAVGPQPRLRSPSERTRMRRLAWNLLLSVAPGLAEPPAEGGRGPGRADASTHQSDDLEAELVDLRNRTMSANDALTFVQALDRRYRAAPVEAAAVLSVLLDRFRLEHGTAWEPAKLRARHLHLAVLGHANAPIDRQRRCYRQIENLRDAGPPSIQVVASFNLSVALALQAPTLETALATLERASDCIRGLHAAEQPTMLAYVHLRRAVIYTMAAIAAGNQRLVDRSLREVRSAATSGAGGREFLADVARVTASAMEVRSILLAQDGHTRQSRQAIDDAAQAVFGVREQLASAGTSAVRRQTGHRNGLRLDAVMASVALRRGDIDVAASSVRRLVRGWNDDPVVRSFHPVVCRAKKALAAAGGPRLEETVVVPAFDHAKDPGLRSFPATTRRPDMAFTVMS